MNTEPKHPISQRDRAIDAELRAGLGNHPGLTGEPTLLFGIGLDGFVPARGDVVHA